LHDGKCLILHKSTVWIKNAYSSVQVDYWIARKGNIHIPSLYSADASSPYYYTKGINFRAYVAWAVGVVLVISGIAGVLKPGSIGIEAVNIYNMSFILSTTSASLAYLLIVKIWPIKVFPPGPHENDPVTWEAMVPTEGFFEEDNMPEYLRQGSERVRTCEPEAQGVFFPSKRD
jgi:NCS1 family nucleobase:cation symporter-1